MLGSTKLILFAIYFLLKLNPNLIPKEIKLWISCISSGLYHVWCHFSVEKNLAFSSRSVLTTTGLANKENSKTITSCKDTLVCCCERWAYTIQDCTTETWVDYCQLGEDCSFSTEIKKLQGSCCWKFCYSGTLFHARGPSLSFLMGSGQWTAHIFRHASARSPETTELVRGRYQLFVYCWYTTNHRYLELDVCFVSLFRRWNI